MTEISRELKQKLESRLSSSPLAAMLNIRIIDLKKDYCELSLEHREEISNGPKSGGTIHGGILASLADVATAYALATNFDGQMSFATVSMNIQFVRRAQMQVLAKARIIKKGRMNISRVEIEDEEGKLVTTALLTFALTKAMAFR